MSIPRFISSPCSFQVLRTKWRDDALVSNNFNYTPVTRRKAHQSRVPNDSESRDPKSNFHQNISIKQICFNKCVFWWQLPSKQALHSVWIYSHHSLDQGKKPMSPCLRSLWWYVVLPRGVGIREVEVADAVLDRLGLSHERKWETRRSQDRNINKRTKKLRFRHQWEIRWDSNMEEWRVTNRRID